VPVILISAQKISLSKQEIKMFH